MNDDPALPADLDPAVDVDPDADAVRAPTFAWGAGTHVGGVRDHNEDAFYASPEVCVVADGMGGHEAGEVASQLVTHIVAELFSTRRPGVSELPRFVSSLNGAVLRRGVENNTRGMGTTVIGVAIADNGDTPSAVIFHVGDSRCYLLRQGAMTQLTTDHSHVQELVQAGRITAEEALTHPLRNVITRALGADAAVEADFHVLDDEDCRLLLCSDGLSGEIDDARIRDLLSAHLDPTDAAVALIDAVLEGPARDNVTAIVIDIAFPPRPQTKVTALHSVDAVFADVTAEHPEVVFDSPTDPDGGRAGWHDPDPSTHAASFAASTAPENASADIGWAPPEADDRQGVAIDRPSAHPDGAAWVSPDAASAQPANNQETGNANEEDHRG